MFLQVHGAKGHIIKKTPSAGLWQNQTDEGELGMSYKELDQCLKAFESNKSSAVKPKIAKQVKRLITLSKHKRKPAPVFGNS